MNSIWCDSGHDSAFADSIAGAQGRASRECDGIVWDSGVRRDGRSRLPKRMAKCRCECHRG